MIKIILSRYNSSFDIINNRNQQQRPPQSQPQQQQQQQQQLYQQQQQQKRQQPQQKQLQQHTNNSIDQRLAKTPPGALPHQRPHRTDARFEPALWASASVYLSVSISPPSINTLPSPSHPPFRTSSLPCLLGVQHRPQAAFTAGITVLTGAAKRVALR